MFFLPAIERTVKVKWCGTIDNKDFSYRNVIPYSVSVEMIVDLDLPDGIVQN